jgi:hypothetical protein
MACQPSFIDKHAPKHLAGLQPLADDGYALTLLAVGWLGFGMGVAATAHMPKFRNKQRPEAAPSPLN